MTDANTWLEPTERGRPKVIETGEAVLRFERLDGEWVIAVSGELDLSNADTLDRELRRAIHETPKVVLDLSGLRFIDSTGIRSLVVAAREAENADCSLGLLRPAADVARTLKMTGIEGTLTFLD